jgi:uncharacterized membrane protein YedE/YeeE
MLVMAGGILVNGAGYFLCVRRGQPLFAKPLFAKPLFAGTFSLPEVRKIDRKLVIGSVLFGMGWGLAGLCPGPVIASIGLNPAGIFPFLAVMLAGLKLGGIIRARLKS